jgi:hypothetical protein
MKVEVVYAAAMEQVIVALEMEAGATAGDAVRRSQLVERFSEIGATPPIGIFGERVAFEHVLEDGDRVEIYRALIADPKEARRRRARARR